MSRCRSSRSSRAQLEKGTVPSSRQQQPPSCGILIPRCRFKLWCRSFIWLLAAFTCLSQAISLLMDSQLNFCRSVCATGAEPHLRTLGPAEQRGHRGVRACAVHSCTGRAAGTWRAACVLAHQDCGDCALQHDAHQVPTCVPSDAVRAPTYPCLLPQCTNRSSRSWWCLPLNTLPKCIASPATFCRLVWSRIWAVLADFFVEVGCHPNLQVGTTGPCEILYFL
jgi:hypothetical protein